MTRAVWSKKHFVNFEGHAFRRHGHRQQFAVEAIKSFNLVLH